MLKKVLVGGYGTLLYQESLNDTIQRENIEENLEFYPVIVKGYMRAFNLRAPHYQSSYRLSGQGNELAAANVFPVEGAYFNGIVYPVNEEELRRLDQRESYYQRHEVEFWHFSDPIKLDKGFIYSAPLTSKLIVSDPDLLLPRWIDYMYARTGAYSVSQSFGEMYDKTTYMADRNTLALDYFKALRFESEDLLIP